MFKVFAWGLGLTAGLLMLAGAASATPISTYSLSLTATVALGGAPSTATGGFTIDGLTGSGTEVFNTTSLTKKLLSLSFDFGPGHVFDLSAAAVGQPLSITFQNGVLQAIEYHGAGFPGALNVSDLQYSYAGNGVANGSFTAALVSTDPGGPNGDPAIPEPATLVLLGAGLAGLGFRRRKA